MIALREGLGLLPLVHGFGGRTVRIVAPAVEVRDLVVGHHGSLAGRSLLNFLEVVLGLFGDGLGFAGGRLDVAFNLGGRLLDRRLDVVGKSLGLVLNAFKFGELRFAVDVRLHLGDKALGLSDPFAGCACDHGETLWSEDHEGDHTDHQHLTETKVKHNYSCLSLKSRGQPLRLPRPLA